jgi:hypothetical protein
MFLQNRFNQIEHFAEKIDQLLDAITFNYENIFSLH